MKRTTRGVDVPPGLSPEGLQCNALRPAESARCQEHARPPAEATRGLTHVGTHQPLLYVLPGAMARLADEPATAIRLARLGNALTSVGLLSLAVALLWDEERGAVSLVGLAFSVTPMVLFLSSSVSTSGPEAAASVCFCAALFRLTRSPPSSRWTWAALAVSGVVLASSRSLGPLWVVLGLAVAVAVGGTEKARQALRCGRKAAAVSLAAVAVAALVSVGWELTVQPHGRLATAELRRWIGPSLGEIPEVLKQQIGVFGSLDSALPPTAYRWWASMLLLLLGSALVVGSVRDRAVLLVLVGTCVGLIVAISALNRSQTGFGMQGRYVLPATVLVPLVAGETILRRWPDGGPALVARLVTLLWLPAAAAQGLSWYANARRSAVGNDVEWIFVGRSEWSPEVGWYPLLGMVAVAVGLMALLAVPARPQALSRPPVATP